MKKENTEVLTLDHGSPLFTVIGTMINECSRTDKEFLVNRTETKAYEMGLFLSTKSKAGHDCVPSW